MAKERYKERERKGENKCRLTASGGKNYSGTNMHIGNMLLQPLPCDGPVRSGVAMGAWISTQNSGG